MQSILGELGESISPFIDRLTDKLPSIINGVLDLVENHKNGMQSLGSKMLVDLTLKCLYLSFAVHELKS